MTTQTIAIECGNCGTKMILAATGWDAVVCQGCRAEIQHPLSGITLKKNNRIKAYYDDDGAEYARFYVLSDGVTIGQIQWNGKRHGWGFTEMRTAPNCWALGRNHPRSQAEAVAALKKSRLEMAVFIREKVVFL